MAGEALSRDQAGCEPDEELHFRRLEHRDIALVHRWLHTPHVARWWHADVGTYEEVSSRYSAYIEGTDPVEPYLILLNGKPIGYIQTYRVSDDEEYKKLIDIEDSAGVDLFIAEEGLLHRGLGLRVIRRFLEEVVFADESIAVCVIGPEPENLAAIRAYEKAGFRHFKSVDTSEGPEYLMKLAREDFLRQ